MSNVCSVCNKSFNDYEFECGREMLGVEHVNMCTSCAEFIANAQVEHGQCYAALISADLIDEFGGLLWAVPDYCDDYCDTSWMLHYTCMNGVELNESIEKLKFGYSPNGSTPNPHTAKVLEEIRIKNRAGV